MRHATQTLSHKLAPACAISLFLAGCNALLGNDPIVVTKGDAQTSENQTGGPDASVDAGPKDPTGGAGGQAPGDPCAAADSDGEPCDDGKHCTKDDRCQDGTCRAGEAVSCSAPSEPCRRSECTESAKGCETMVEADGTACGDGDVCQDGKCVCKSSAASESKCGDKLDDDCDGKVDCADPDCETSQCGAAATVQCCRGQCVNTQDRNNSVCPWPPAFQGDAGDPTGNGCAYVQECDYRRFVDQEVGTVCRTYPGEAVEPACFANCKADVSNFCPNKIVAPFWLCNAQSTQCRLVPY